MEYRDYYATLGVPRTASQADVKKAFRKLARKHHPDVNKTDPSAEARFKEVNEAYAVLGEPDKRKAYDSLGPDWEAYQRAGAGAGRGRGRARRGGWRRRSGAFPGGMRFEFQGDPADLAGFSDFFRTFFAGGAGGAGAAGCGRRARSRPAAGSTARGTAQANPGGLDLNDLLSGFGTAGGTASGVRYGSGSNGSSNRERQRTTWWRDLSRGATTCRPTSR